VYLGSVNVLCYVLAFASMSAALNEFLRNAYGGFADKRFTRLEFDRPVRINEQTYELNPHIHCRLFVRVQPNERFILSLSGNLPWSKDVAAVTGALGAEKASDERPRHIEVELDVSDATIAALRQLARAVEGVTAPGRRYDTPSWKFASKEVSGDLRRLARTLKEFRASSASS
jgi:hypothetical protein